MNHLIDTCLISELIKKKPEASVVEWIRQQEEQTLYLSVLTLGEVRKGIVKAQDSEATRKASKLARSGSATQVRRPHSRDFN